MSNLAISQEEILTRKEIANHAMKLITSNMPIESTDENSILTVYKGFYLQISFSEVHPLIVFCFARATQEGFSLPFHKVNELNLNGIFGCHCVDSDGSCYTYRAIHWLDVKLSKGRLMEILDRYTEEAVRGYILLSS